MVTTSSARTDVFTVRTDEDGDSLTIQAVGELDIASAPALESALRHALDSGAA